ncbi:unnamed protein product [Lymnaea stagnalis]|uniref:TNFR-Cys domain-containing protein n=1 Tax=Lymnaea stagnalis TaxID=6523 RepID=A0AAV2HGA4_LYMST
MAQFVGFALLVGASCLPFAQFSDSSCGRGTYLDVNSTKCIKCPEQKFMDEDYHKHTKCKDCRRINEYHNDNIIDFHECNATHDLYFKCHPTHYVDLEDHTDKIFGCSMCQNCSNGQSFTTLPCDGVNDTLCCASDDMVAEVKGDGKYACAAGPSTKTYTTTMQTPKSSDGLTTSNNGYAGDVTSQTSNQYEQNLTASSDNSGRNEHDGWFIPVIVSIIVIIIIVIIITVVCCLAKRHKITVRKYLTGCCTREVEEPVDPRQTAQFIKKSKEVRPLNIDD